MKRDLEFINTVIEGSEETHSQVNINFDILFFSCYDMRELQLYLFIYFMVDIYIITE